MPDNSSNFINSIVRSNASSGTSAASDRGSLLAQSLTSSRAGLNTRVTRTPAISSGQSGRQSSTATGAINNSTSGRGSNNTSTLRLFDLNGDKTVTDEELIDVALEKHFSDPDMASPYNINAGDITRLVAKVDTDLNGQISDVELAKALLSDRREELSTLDSQIKNYLLNKNLNRTAIETELNNFNSASSDHVISDLEALDKLKALKASNTTITAATRAVLGTNPHYSKIQELLNNTNFGDIKSPQQIFDFLLSARKFGVEDVFATRELTGNQPILDLVKGIDKDADGVISQKEFIAGYVGVNKKGNPDHLDINLFDSLITSQSRFSGVPAFIDSIVDTNGNIDETQAATLITTAKNNPASDNTLLLDVVKELSSNGQFKKLVGLLKPTPGISSGELVSVLLASRNPAFSSIQTTVFSTLIDVDAGIGADYNNAIIDIDTNNNGIIDNDEVSRALLRNNSGDTKYSDTMLTDILSTNTKYADIKKLVDLFDAGATKDGVYSNVEIVKGLLDIKRLKLDVDNKNLNSDLRTALLNNDSLQSLSSLVNQFDPDSSGTISAEEYASIMVAIARGLKPEIDPNLLTPIESQVPTAAIIKNAIQAFADDLDKDLTPQQLMDKFKPLINDSNGNIDANKLATMTKVIGIIYPNADQLINVYLNFDTDHDNKFSDSEVTQGLLKYNSGLFGKLSSTALDSIVKQADHPDAIKYALSIIDSKSNGNISDTEVIDALTKIKRGDFIADTKFNSDIFNQILTTNSNYALADRIMSTFNYAPGFKPTTVDLAASVLVQKYLGTVTDADKTSFLNMLGLTKSADIDQIANINTEITKLGTAAFDANKKLRPEVLLDKLILLSLGKLQSSTALTALLRTNSGYDQMNRLFNKYSENKKFTENSLVRILVDASRSDLTVQLKPELKNYFISILSGTSALREYNNELLGITISGIDDPIVKVYDKAIKVLDPNRTGKMTASDYSLHQYYITSQYGSTGSYDFDNNGKVDDKDIATFNRVANYLKINS